MCFVVSSRTSQFAAPTTTKAFSALQKPHPPEKPLPRLPLNKRGSTVWFKENTEVPRIVHPLRRRQASDDLRSIYNMDGSLDITLPENEQRQSSSTLQYDVKKWLDDVDRVMGCVDDAFSDNRVQHFVDHTCTSQMPRFGMPLPSRARNFSRPFNRLNAHPNQEQD